MIDVIYPLMNASKFGDDFELRYSLRSLMLQNWVKNVYLIGHCPKWVKGIIHIPCGDPYVACKDANIINKVILGCSQKGISENLLINSDDQYFLNPIDIDNVIPLIENPCRFNEYKFKAGINTWHKRAVDSVKWCKENGYPDWILQSHTPYVINKHEYVDAMSKVTWGKGNGFVTHVYFNLTEKEEPVKEYHGQTLRLKGRIQSSELKKQIEKAMFFNFNNDGLTLPVKNFLEDYFPVPSRWEV